jgi:TetR/AcrR family transcriptional regulator, regulator of autoinduction and epiphytic fitness
MGNVSAGEKIDGRTARARRTREAIVDAMLALLDAGDLRPSVEDIAARAQVSPRSIFQHFGDRETLLRAVGARQAERVSQIVEHIADTGQFEARLDAFVDQRVRVLEFITPVRRSALLHEPFSAGSHAGIQAFRAYKRAEAERVFGPELGELQEGERLETVRALGAATDWSTWEALSVHQGLSADDARAVMRRTIVALLHQA